jgi:hypothetical protein
MTTQQIFRLAYSAARRANRMNDRADEPTGSYYSPLRMALDATIALKRSGHSHTSRVPVPYRMAKIAAQIANKACNLLANRAYCSYRR